MFVDGRENYVRALGYQRLREQAARRRFERDVLGIQTDLPKPCCVTLAWLGRKLIAWGARMQAKYGSFEGGGNIAAMHLLLLALLCLSLSACQTVTLASDSDLGLPLAQPDPDRIVHILYVGNLCAGCADAHLEQLAAGLDPPRRIEVDSVVIPKY